MSVRIPEDYPHAVSKMDPAPAPTADAALGGDRVDAINSGLA